MKHYLFTFCICLIYYPTVFAQQQITVAFDADCSFSYFAEKESKRVPLAELSAESDIIFKVSKPTSCDKKIQYSLIGKSNEELIALKNDSPIETRFMNFTSSISVIFEKEEVLKIDLPVKQNLVVQDSIKADLSPSENQRELMNMDLYDKLAMIKVYAEAKLELYNSIKTEAKNIVMPPKEFLEVQTLLNSVLSDIERKVISCGWRKFNRFAKDYNESELSAGMKSKLSALDTAFNNWVKMSITVKTKPNSSDVHYIAEKGVTVAEWTAIGSAAWTLYKEIRELKDKKREQVLSILETLKMGSVKATAEK